MNGKWYQQSKIWPKELKSPEGLKLASGLPRTSAAFNITPGKVLVDMSKKGIPIPKSDKNEISKFLHEVGRKYWTYIPVKEIFDMLESHGIVPVQEDGTKWSGLILGDKECGHPECINQRTVFQVAIRQPDGLWALSKNGIFMAWCTLWGTGSKKYEIVSYVS